MKTIEPITYRRITGLFILVMLFLSGCLKSLNPFYKAEQLVKSSTYQGVWESDANSYWVFLPLENVSEIATKSENAQISLGKNSKDGMRITGTRSQDKLDLDVEVSSNFLGYGQTEQEELVKQILENAGKQDSMRIISTREAETDQELLNTKKRIEDHLNNESELNSADALESKLCLLVHVDDSTKAMKVYKDFQESQDIEEEVDFYIAAFFELDGRILLDMTPYEFGDRSLESRHHIPVHSLSKVEHVESSDIMELKFFSSSRIEDLITNDRVRINYMTYRSMPEELSEDEALVLSAQTEELQAFIKKLLNMDETSYLSSSDSSKLKRIAK